MRSFTVWSDHKNLQYFQTKRQLNERQARWAETLSRYNYQLTYRKGSTAVVPDALSRREQDMPADAADDRLAGRFMQLLPQTGRVRVAVTRTARYDDDAPTDDQIPERTRLPSPFDDAELTALWDGALQRNNKYWLLRSTVAQEARQFPPQWQVPLSISECTLDTHQRLLWRDRIWIPHDERLRTKIIQQTHDSSLGGHPGRDQTSMIISRQYFWPGLSQDVRQFLRNCDVCGRSTLWREKKRGFLKPLPVPDRPWAELSMDFITGLPPSNGATNILVITDRLTKSLILEPMTTTTAEDVASVFLRSFVRHHGIPRAITSDRGPQFVGLFWSHLCELLRITRRVSTAFHPETDGATERANQEVEAYLRAYTAYQQSDWADLLPAAMLAINNHVATSTGISPFNLTHGYDVDILAQSQDADTSPPRDSPIGRADALHSRLREATTFAQAAMASAQERQSHYADEHRQAAPSFAIGSTVWLRLKNVHSKRPSKKLDWVAAKYRVIDKAGPLAYKLDTPPGIHPVFHVSLLKPCADDPLPSQTRIETQTPAILADGAPLYDVDRILKHKRRGRGHAVLVKWTGYADPTWEPLGALRNTIAYQEYEATLPAPLGGGGVM